MHLPPHSDDNPADCTFIGALRRMQYGLIATLLAIAAAFAIKGFAA